MQARQVNKKNNSHRAKFPRQNRAVPTESTPKKMSPVETVVLDGPAPLIKRCHPNSERAVNCTKAFNKKRPVMLYKGKDAKEIVAKAIAEIDDPCIRPLYDSWDVTDIRSYIDPTTGEEFELAMVHFTDSASSNERCSMKGVIINITHKEVVVYNSAEIPVTCLSRIEVGQVVSIVPATSLNIDLAYPIYEDQPFVLSETDTITETKNGVIMRALRYMGNNFLCSNKSLSVERSIYPVYGGKPLTFLEMYQEANGPTFEELFDLSKPFSACAYLFNVCHPLLYGASKQIMESPHVVLIGRLPMFDKGELTSNYINYFENAEPTTNPVTGSGVKIESEITVDEANIHLKDGYYGHLFDEPQNNAEWRERLGGSVMIARQMKSQDGKFSYTLLIQVNSPSYQLRHNLQGQVSNMFSRVVRLVEDSLGVAQAVDVKEDRRKKMNPILKANKRRLAKMSLNHRRIDPLIKESKFRPELIELYKSMCPAGREADVDRLFSILAAPRADVEVTEKDVVDLFLANMFYMNPFNTMAEFFEVYDSTATAYIDLVRKAIDVVRLSPDIGEDSFKYKSTRSFPLLSAVRNSTLLSLSDDIDLDRFAADLTRSLEVEMPLHVYEIFDASTDLKDIKRRIIRKNEKLAAELNQLAAEAAGLDIRETEAV